MTYEEKQLLLKDLSARIPYEVKVRHSKIIQDLTIALFLDFVCLDTKIKPYLRPMSSMTEKELNSLKQCVGLIYGYPNDLELLRCDSGYTVLEFWLEEIPHYVVDGVFDWLNEHHFDYRGLIEKGLALEAPNGMYN